jgi:steroid delta-isomerase-like uncharacterized protein
MIRATLIVFVAIISWVTPLGTVWARGAVAQEATPAGACPTTTPDENEELVRSYTEGVWDQGSADADAFFAEDSIYHWVGPVADFAAWQAGFPDRTTTIEHLAAAGDLVALRWTAAGTHEGEFHGIAPTGTAANWTGNSILRLECGKIAEVWVHLNLVGLYRQLGVTIGPPPQRIAATPAASQEDVAPATPAAECPATTADENEDVIRRWYDEVWSQGNYDAIGDLIAPSHVHDRAIDEPATGVAEYEANARRWRASFPDLVFTPDELVADGDLVFARWTATGTHEGDYYSIAATGSPVEWEGITLFRFDCGKIADSWIEADSYDFFQQLDVDMPIATPAAE